MNMIPKSLYVFLLILPGFLHAQQIRVGIISDHLAPGELKEMKAMLSKDKSITFSETTFSELSARKKRNSFTHIWYHRTDTLPFDKAEKDAGKWVRDYVSKGGNVFLSMESVPLLNTWKIEAQPFQLGRDTIRDEGFGRPLGFHSFRKHAIFNGLQGGVYTSKLKKDHPVRKHGFFQNKLPEQGKVIGIQWTYITFTEHSKILLEYPVGKGKIIAAGSYMYYDADNYNAGHLEKFTHNVFHYTAGNFKDVASNYWSYEKPQLLTYSFKTPGIDLIKAGKWNLPSPTLALKQEKGTQDFFDLVGRKILWMGKLNSGIEEIWMHPFMALRDFSVGVKTRGSDSISWLKNRQAMVTVAPEYLVRNYSFGNSTVREIQTVSFEDPAGVVHLEMEGEDILEVVVRYGSNLRFMWPYSHDATKSIRYNYQPGLNAHVISGQDGALNTVVAYSQVPASQEMKVDTGLRQVKVEASFSMNAGKALNVYITGSNNNYEEAVKLFSEGQRGMSELFVRSNSYYNSLLKEHLVIETPDSQFNVGYKWALARTDQFLQTTPGIGTALMAGFGTTARGWNGRHQVSGRPGYAWYFGRDGEWSAMAINAYGGFAMVKEILEALVRYQDISGKIYHELTSSGVAHYDASDATPLFITLAAHYLRYSGDMEYIRKIWPHLKKAMDFCFTTDTDGDGLIENTNVGHGWIEGGSLFGTHTEFYLAGCWANALESAAYIAEHLSLNDLKSEYDQQAVKVKAIIDRDFWNEQQQFFHNGKMQDGSYMPDANVLATVPVYLKAVTDTGKIFKVNSRLNSSYFSTDWGIRMLEDSSKKYRPNSYHAGMVWPLYGGWASLSEFQSGHNRAGFQHIMNNLLVYKHWGPGSVEETLNGDHYTPNGVCSHQCWSETMVLQPAIEGMLGLEPDAMAANFRLAPYFPWNWNNTTVKNIRIGDAVVHMEMKREEGLTFFTISSNKEIMMDFDPRFPWATSVTGVELNGSAIPFSLKGNAEGLSVSIAIPLKKGTSRLVVKNQGGVGALPVMAMPVPGDSSLNHRIVSEGYNNKTLSLAVQGRPGKTGEIRIFSTFKPVSAEGAKIVSHEENIIVLSVTTPSTSERYSQQQVKIFLK